ncbi:hypothetical protein [Tardiphaga sp.]|uniref:hypothetical protein n=1 Tax=Tardiphaga sp. TaxID=1926292 RepID=UPI0025F1C787|nr:hypothetical protein [Tardiphaga sp.]
MATTEWDKDFLDDRESEAEAVAFKAQCDADWQQAVRQVRREISEMYRGFERCADRACRRARRCMAEDCIMGLAVPLPDKVMRSLVQDVYAEIQQDRREAALALRPASRRCASR